MSLRCGAVWLVATILVLSACGDDSGDSADEATQTTPTTSAPSSTTTTRTTEPDTTTTMTTLAPATTTTAAPPTTTTTEPERHEEAPILFDLVVSDADWGAEPGTDPLRATIRSGPGYSNEAAAMIAVPRRVMEGTGAVRSDEQGVAWRELSLGLGRTGWVEADRLEINFAAQTSYFDDPCATEGASQGLSPISGDVSDNEGPADHVAQVWHLIGPGCDRLHIAFGTEWDYASGGSLAAVSPEGVTVDAFGTWARITVPGLEAARSDAAAENSWNLSSVVARGTDRTLFIDVYAPGPSLFAAHVLRDPARLLVDVIPAGDGHGPPPADTLQLHAGPGSLPESETEPTDAVRLRASPASMVVWPGPLETQNPREVSLPLVVRGYSRWFEAGGVVELENADGTAAFATVTGSQVFNPGTDSSWGLTATDWLESWGTFEFTIDNIEPGEYQLLVGEYPPIDDNDFIGVTIPIRVLAP